MRAGPNTSHIVAVDINSIPRARPRVLVFGGHDPSGGAGIAADTSTLLALGCHPLVVVTAITVQNTQALKRYQLLPPELIAAQASCVLDDADVAVSKTGMLGSSATVATVAGILSRAPASPLVVDPVLLADQGGSLSEPDLGPALRKLLFPRATVATPNLDECFALASTDNVDDAARELLALGCQNILVTGTSAATPQVVHRLYRSSSEEVEASEWPRLSRNYHGSGCTLASALAAFLAHGHCVSTAAQLALEYTWRALQHGYQPGLGQSVPNRLWRSQADS